MVFLSAHQTAMAPNQNPEQEARDNIDFQLSRSGWTIQDRKKLNLSASAGVAVREYPTDTGPADYVLFVNSLPVGIIEAKPENQGGRLHVHEAQKDAAQRVFKFLLKLEND